MATRNIKDAVVELQEAYSQATEEFQRKYPNDPQPFTTCVYRSNEEQESLYAQGRTAPGKIVTHARAGQSKHNLKPSQAFDIGFITLNKKVDWSPRLFKQFADIIEPMGIKWGGRFHSFKDNPHFEV